MMQDGRNSCFAVIKRGTHDKYLGTHAGIGYVGPCSSDAEAESEAKRKAANLYTNVTTVTQMVGSVEMVR